MCSDFGTFCLQIIVYVCVLRRPFIICLFLWSLVLVNIFIVFFVFLF